MDSLRLARIEPAHLGADPPRWDSASQYHRQPAQRRRPPARQRLLASLAPGYDPESLDVEYEVDSDGELLVISVRDRASGTIIRRLLASELKSLGDQSAPGMLIERRG
jgi:hypothetical protein